MKKFVVVLSNEGDLMKLVDVNTYGATFSTFEATKYDTEAEAKEVIQDLEIRFMWPEVHTQAV